MLCLPPSASQTRVSTRLDDGWLFRIGQVEGGQNPELDDTDWQPVRLPHCWGWREAQQGKRYYRGPGWYRRRLDGPFEPGKRYFLRFEAAGSVADVYLNGKHVGQHRGAFGAFCFEITDVLQTSGGNILAVRVDNSPQQDIAPLSGDFCMFGGLYRPVNLIQTGQVCFSLTDHGSSGLAWLQTKVGQAEAIIDLTAQISNGTKAFLDLVITATILDHQGNKVATQCQAARSAPRTVAPYWLRITLPSPRLWQGRNDPYLYTAVAEICDANGQILDQLEHRIGLRSYYVDPEKGFFLNGQPYHLHGVNRHQDRPDKGWAITEQDQQQDLQLILDMGCTVVRCAHYQHSDYFYSLCDQAGLLVWAELPLVDRIDPSDGFANTSRSQLLDLIRQNINHPSIFAWSLYNELRPGNPDPHRLLQDLHNLAKAEDPTRPTIAATCTTGLPQMNKITDLLGWNIYPGWYPEWGPLSDFSRHLDLYRNTSRTGGFCVSEYGAGANIAHQEEEPNQPVHNGQWHPEQWQAILHEYAWAQMKTRPYVWGTFIWNMFDFTSYWRNEGGIPGRNDKGLVTYDRATCKDAYYFYKANWTTEPMVYITSRRLTTRSRPITDIKVYSNCQKVRLMVNGNTIGILEPNDLAICLWQNVQLRQGTNTIEAVGVSSNGQVTDRCQWELAPSK
ncbi:MAG: glycoside hydrolase family 2 TIM barrel-domain containing protein [Sedimentisphaerales bacterium]|nr:glycoside hydrolase family 2 TIM barrel-domain containing protein [Sedimentisphaerales bacterium]